MGLSTPFIHRPVGTTLLTIAIALAGMLAYFLLPVAPLPQVDFPTIEVYAGLPGASAETMASSVATPLERQFGRIAGVSEMTSSCSLGDASITLQFELNRDINAAARDVQACISAARAELPANMPSNPGYYKVNPADAPILILSITSNLYDKAHIFDAASSIVAQKLSQLPGVGQVHIGGGSLPAVRVEVNPMRLNALDLGLDDVATALGNANANRPKGQIVTANRTIELATTDQLFKASQYRSLLLCYRHGAPVRLEDVADVNDGLQDERDMAIANGRPAVLLRIFRQPGANIIATADGVKRLMPVLAAEIPAAMHMNVVMDRTTTIRASVHDVEYTLVLSVALVIGVVFVFLRDWRTTLIPSVAVPVSLMSTFGVMWLCGYSLDNLSLMALTIATGFVVDDAIVVIENVTRYLERGYGPLEASLKGAAEIGFTVLSISVSLVAVFIPLLLMGGLLGRLFREFAVTLSVAIGVSMLVSLTTTPMMCAALLKAHRAERKHGLLYRASERGFNIIHRLYERSLAIVLQHEYVMLLVTVATIGLTIYLYIMIPKGFFPQEDTGRLNAWLEADQDTSFEAMGVLLRKLTSIIQRDPAVATVVGGCGSGYSDAWSFVSLKPLNQRKETVEQVIDRLRPQLMEIPGASMYLSPVQDLHIGGRSGQATYQYTLEGDNVTDLLAWAPKVTAALKKLNDLVDVDSDQQDKGLAANIAIDRTTASRLGVTPQQIDSILGYAFGQSEVSTMYTHLNQYHVVLEVAPQFRQGPECLKYIYVKTSDSTFVPLSTFCRFDRSTTPLAINHQSGFPAVTISFSLAADVSLGQAVDEIQQAEGQIGLPGTVHGIFAGNAHAYQEALRNEPILIGLALFTIYIVLGILYESFVHPITILSTLPSAGVGALLALLLTGCDLTIIALIGIILLVGIVKKNAIMMIDVALATERNGGATPAQAIYHACVLRFRPIMMTTFAALLGALPLALGTGTGSEIRRPLGIAIVGGLIFSQMLTLYTTPVVYLFLDRLRGRVMGPAHPLPWTAEPAEPEPALI